jgi:hypothetical protein
MNIKKGVIHFSINYVIATSISWLIVFFFKLFLRDIPLGILLSSEGLFFELALYIFFSLLLVIVFYIYSFLEKLLIENRILFAVGILLAQLLLQSGIEGLIDYKFLAIFSNQYLNLFVFYLIIVGMLVVFLKLFRVVSRLR